MSPEGMYLWQAGGMCLIDHFENPLRQGNAKASQDFGYRCGHPYTLELFLHKIERGSTAQHRRQWHPPQSQLCDCGKHAPKWCSVSCHQWHAQ
jgi:hypothetical protein